MKLKKSLSVLFAVVFLVAFGSAAFAGDLHLSTPPEYIHAGAVPVVEASSEEYSHLSGQPMYTQAGAVPIIEASSVEYSHLESQPMYTHAGAVPIIEVPVFM